MPETCLPKFGWSFQIDHQFESEKAVLKCRVVPRAFCSLGQNRDVNQGSWSDIIDTVTTWSLTISLMYSLANLSKDKVLRTTKKCADLVSRSTITQMASWPIWVRGKSTTKSMVMCSYFHFGIGKGWMVSGGFWYSAFTYWHTRQVDTYSATSLFILNHQ